MAEYPRAFLYVFTPYFKLSQSNAYSLNLLPEKLDVVNALYVKHSKGDWVGKTSVVPIPARPVI